MEGEWRKEEGVAGRRKEGEEGRGGGGGEGKGEVTDLSADWLKKSSGEELAKRKAPIIKHFNSTNLHQFTRRTAEK